MKKAAVIRARGVRSANRYDQRKKKKKKKIGYQETVWYLFQASHASAYETRKALLKPGYRLRGK